MAILLFLDNITHSVQLAAVQYYDPIALDSYKRYFCDLYFAGGFGFTHEQIAAPLSAANESVVTIGLILGAVEGIWFYICWGAFREFNKKGKLLSFIAFLLWVFISHEAMFAAKLMAKAAHFLPC